MENVSNCIVVKTGFWGNDWAHNVCNGTVMPVPWGALDWIGFSMTMVVLGIFAAALGFFVWWNWPFLVVKIKRRKG